jgi:Cu2+-containing amine oxidase
MSTVELILTKVKQNGSSVLPNGVKPALNTSTVPHPLDQLDIDETEQARKIVLKSVGQSILEFRSIYLEEPPKEQLLPFLESERKGGQPTVSCPPRIATIHYDIVHSDKSHEYVESSVDLQKQEVLSRQVKDISRGLSFFTTVQGRYC